MISIIISSCFNKPERKVYLSKVLKCFKEVIPDAEILVGFDKCGEEMEFVDKYIVHNKGMGHSWNWGIRESKYDWVLQTEDDWMLKLEHEISTKEDFAKVLLQRIEVLKKYEGIYRLDNLALDWWKAGWTPKEHEEYNFFELNKPEKYVFNNLSMYYYSNHPHLKNKKLQQDVGWFLEDVEPHRVEEDMCKRYYNSGQRVFFSKYNTFVHIGDISARE